MVIWIEGEFYRLRYIDSGVLRPEDRDLWRCLKVTWDGDHFGVHDDDDWLIDMENRKVVARETGWDLRREVLW